MEALYSSPKPDVKCIAVQSCTGHVQLEYSRAHLVCQVLAEGKGSMLAAFWHAANMHARTSNIRLA